MMGCEGILLAITVQLEECSIGIHREPGRYRVLTQEYNHPTIQVYAWSTTILGALRNFAEKKVAE